MIKDLDRSRYFGASDTKFIMAENQTTLTWARWWNTKLGSGEPMADNIYTRAGTLFEHPILDAIDEDITKDGQIIIEGKRLRVNYDGFKEGVIYEVKTHGANKDFRVTSDYYGQVQVEMYVYQEMSNKWFLPPFNKLYIVDYALVEDDYYTTEPVVDPSRLHKQEIEYDPKFIKKYLRRLKRLSTKLCKELGEEFEWKE